MDSIKAKPTSAASHIAFFCDDKGSRLSNSIQPHADPDPDATVPPNKDTNTNALTDKDTDTATTKPTTDNATTMMTTITTTQNHEFSDSILTLVTPSAFFVSSVGDDGDSDAQYFRQHRHYQQHYDEDEDDCYYRSHAATAFKHEHQRERDCISHEQYIMYDGVHHSLYNDTSSTCTSLSSSSASMQEQQQSENDNGSKTADSGLLIPVTADVSLGVKRDDTARIDELRHRLDDDAESIFLPSPPCSHHQRLDTPLRSQDDTTQMHPNNHEEVIWNLPHYHPDDAVDNYLYYYYDDVECCSFGKGFLQLWSNVLKGHQRRKRQRMHRQLQQQRQQMELQRHLHVLAHRLE